MADQEQAARGDRLAGLAAAHDAFYRGDIAAAIVRHQAENGGWLRADDLAEFRARVEPPCRTRFGEFDVYGCGPWSQGPMVLQALNILEGLDLRGMGHNSPAYIHAVTEALKLAAADREAYFGDPDFVDVPLGTLLAKDYAARRRGLIDPARAWPEMPPAGCGRWRDAAALAARSLRRVRRGAGGGEAGDVVSVRGRSARATCSPPRRATARSAGRWCRAPAFCRRCGVRAAIPGATIQGASVPAAGRACRPIRRSRSSRGGW